MKDEKSRSTNFMSVDHDKNDSCKGRSIKEKSNKTIY